MSIFDKLQQQKRILLVTTSHVGNNIFCTPAIHLLKKYLPQVSFDLLAMSDRGADVFTGNSDIDRVYQSRRKSKIRRFAKRYDVVISFYADKTAELLYGLPQVIANPALPGQQHRADEMLNFISNLLGHSLTAADRHYFFCCSQQQPIQHWLEPSSEKIFIGLHLGNGITAVHGWKFWYRKKKAAKSSRLWSIQDYVELAQRLQQWNPNIRLVITGSKNESFLGKEFCEALPNTINLIGKTSLLDLVALMNYLNIFITQDTGALHAACASAVNLIGLFGPTNPILTGPYPLKPQHTLIQKASMQEITTLQVFLAVVKILNGSYEQQHFAASTFA